MLALALIPNEEICNLVKRTWVQLNKRHNINFIAKSSSKPHITLIAGLEESFQIEIDKFLKLEKNNWHSFEMSTKGLGIFLLEKPLIYLRWKNSNELNLLRKNILGQLKLKGILQDNIEYNEDWKAKTTIAYQDILYNNKLIEIINTIKSEYKQEYKSKINNLEIIKYKEGFKEKSILNYKFH